MGDIIAIRDHPGIISFLESLGGENRNRSRGGGDWIPFSIDRDGTIFCPVICHRMEIEDFKKEYMYEIGSKVKHKKKLFPCRIEKISLRYDKVVYTLRTAFGKHIEATKDEFVLKR